MTVAKPGASRRTPPMARSISFIRWCGIAAMLGGGLWVIGTVIHASKPRGCVARECAFRPMRESGVLDGTLMLLSLLLFAAGGGGVGGLAPRPGRLGETGKAGGGVGAIW